MLRLEYFIQFLNFPQVIISNCSCSQTVLFFSQYFDGFHIDIDNEGDNNNYCKISDLMLKRRKSEQNVDL